MARRWIRNHEAGALTESFLVSGVVAILAIRFYLDLTGYPQVGGATLHIAHMLWGGLMMLAALVTLFTFLDRGAVRLAAVVGGLGFGTFIDELGKFVTRDNDYFFQPTVALIYVVFVLTFLAAHSVRSRRAFTRDEWLVNALRETEELAVQDLDPVERRRALAFLERSDPDHPLVPPLRRLLREAEPVAAPVPGWLVRLANRARDLYQRLIRWPLFTRGLILFFVIQLAVKLGWAVSTLFRSRGADDPGEALTVLERFVRSQDSPTFVEWGELTSSLLSGVFVLLGVLALRRSRLTAYRWFERSILVSILLTQIFTFYHEQFAALAGLAVNLVFLGALRYMIGREQETEEEAEATAPVTERAAPA
jgi:hypothetical protein